MIDDGNDISPTEAIFKELEKWREHTETTIDEMAFLLNVTPLAYKNWKNNAAIPQARRYPQFKRLLNYFETNADCYKIKNLRRRRYQQKRGPKSSDDSESF